MNPEMRQAVIARAHRDRSEAVAALVVAAIRGLRARVLRFRRAWVSEERTRVDSKRRDRSRVVDTIV